MTVTNEDFNEPSRGDLVIQMRGVTKNYDTPVGRLEVLQGVDLEVRRKEFLTIMGPSGSGKSTLLNIIGLLDQFDGGTYFIGANDVGALTPKQKQLIRLQKIGFVFQTFNLIPTLTVRENIEVPMALLKIPQSEQAQRSQEIMERFGIWDKRNSFVHQLSIGEQQRVAFGRALTNNPALILADEPTGNLDAANAERVMGFMRELTASTTILVVTHNPELRAYADHNYELRSGKLALV